MHRFAAQAAAPGNAVAVVGSGMRFRKGARSALLTAESAECAASSATRHAPIDSSCCRAISATCERRVGRGRSAAGDVAGRSCASVAGRSRPQVLLAPAQPSTPPLPSEMPRGDAECGLTAREHHAVGSGSSTAA
jgi:hypothetical protein